MSTILYYFCLNNQEEILLLEKLAKKIKTRRNELNISQEKLAEICGFDRTYISLLERAKRNPSFLNLKKLSIGLDIALTDLLKDA
jgi:transcriptional regulator with XRE-family HTH domain